MHTKLLVLGGGPGGYAAAFYAADHGCEVTLVEAEARLGGTCLLRGCIPSKALLHVARVIAETEELQADWGVEFGRPQIEIEKLRQRKEKVITTLSSGLKNLAKRRQVKVLQATGKFLDSQTVQLVGTDPGLPPDGRLTFDRCILATGSIPAMPPGFAAGSPRVMDSAGALELRDIPGTLLVIGGGYIGLEMGTVYARLGSQVSVVEWTEGLLPGVDRDLVKPLQKRLELLFGGRIFLNTKVASLADRGEQVEVAFEGPGKSGTERFDRVLVAVGRRPNSHNLGLEQTKVELTPQGFVVVDSCCRTADARILAVGDVAGEPMLAHKAAHQARTAVETVLGHEVPFGKQTIPAVVFTDPEIAWAGLTEEQAKKTGQPFETTVYPWAASGRAQALGRTEGLTKWLFNPTTRRVLGCGLVGPGAGELIGEAVLAIEMECEARILAGAIHPHPTLSETLMNAGEVLFGTATEIYKPRRPAQVVSS